MALLSGTNVLLGGWRTVTELDEAQRAFLEGQQQAMLASDDGALQAAHDEYTAVVSRVTAERLRRAGHDRQAIVVAITQYLDAFACDTVGYSPSTLCGQFVWDTPSVLSLAGFEGTESDRVMRVYATVARNRWQPGSPPLPPDHP